MNKNPIENIIADGGFTAILRSIGCVGDSLSSGEYEYINKDGVRCYYDFYEHSWGQFIARKCGIKCYNFSSGGMTATEFVNSYADHNKMFTKEKACNAYIIALGVNDLNPNWVDRNYPELGFGSLDDVDFNDYSNNKRSFVGCYIKIIQRILKLQPNAKIFVMTIPKGINPELEPIRDKHAKFIRSLEKLFPKKVFTLDIRKYAPTFDEEFREKYFLNNHMNSLGYKYFADIVATYISNIIEENYTCFKQVALIGSQDYDESLE